MAKEGILKSALGQITWYRRSLSFFLVALVVVAGGWAIYAYSRPLSAASPLDDLNTSDDVLNFTLAQNGNLYLENSRVNAEVNSTSTTYRYRYQVVNQPKELVERLTIDVSLPAAVTEDTVAYRFVSNGGANLATAQLKDAQTLEYYAEDISTQAQLAIEFEVPKTIIAKSVLFTIQEYLLALPIAIWVGISIGLPALAFLVLFLVGLAKNRRVSPFKGDIIDPPSRLTPAMLGILLHGRLTNRELAATLLDLSRRGHLVIRRLSDNDFRFRRRKGNDRLEDYEQLLLDQIFGPVSEAADAGEISFFLAQELFSKKVSQAFVVAYRKVNQLGYFYTNPLKIHRRYQIFGLFLFVLGLIGFAINLFLITNIQYLLFFWAGMMAASLMVTYFAKSLPVRTVHGDRELAMWLGFRNMMIEDKPISFSVASQDKYLAYLPYAVIFGVETEWTKRFYDLPFTQPAWYVAANVATIDKFANQIFPFLGYLSHALALSSQPATR